MIEKTSELRWIGSSAPDSKLFDLSLWPIVIARFPELDEEHRVKRVLDSLDAILEQNTSYVIIWRTASHNHDEEAHEDEKQSNKWIKTRREDINKLCKGYVYIVNNPEFRSELESHLAVVSARLFKFPMKIVEQQTDAISLAHKMLEHSSS
ncbi:MAG: hypothetical protein AAGA50_09375 [Pseudomonadota bacterium]